MPEPEPLAAAQAQELRDLVGSLSFVFARTMADQPQLAGGGQGEARWD
jgi:hypothetical protein